MNTPIPGATRRPARIEKTETAVLVLILLVVGISAGAASFTHVHDWTMTNSPAHTGDWFGWANAAVSELVPIAALLVMRRRKRAGQPISYPAFLLTAALALSVTAQLAVAKPGISGAIVSVVPALAFAALSKLILGKTPNPADDTTTIPAVALASPAKDRPQPQPLIVPDRPEPETMIVPDRPAPIPVEPVSAVPVINPVPTLTDNPRPTPAPTPVPAPVPTTQDEDRDEDGDEDRDEDGDETSGWPVPPIPADLLARARTAATEHLDRTGQAITRDELRAVLRLSNATTGDVMRALGLTRRAPATPVAAVNGSTPALF